ncbi:MAG: carbonic anhydrase [Patescibacteria group bacterium]
MASDKKFACAINCMDGRVQDAVKNYMKENYGADYVDMVTEPGPNKILASPELAEGLVENIKKRVEISVHHHGSKVVAIVGHFGCAGNPTEKNVQIEQLKKCKEKVEAFGFPAEIVLLWVEGDWKTVELI